MHLPVDIYIYEPRYKIEMRGGVHSKTIDLIYGIISAIIIAYDLKKKILLFCRRDGTSWGFSIVGGADPGAERTEPVHVLFVVPESPAAKVQHCVHN